MSRLSSLFGRSLVPAAQLLSGLSLLLMLLLTGCGVSVEANQDPVDITGKLTMGGKPVDAVNINFQPTDKGLPAVIEVTKGSFAAKVTPGKYTYYLTAGKSPKSIEAIPRHYQEGSMARQFDITDSTALDFTIE